MRPQLAKASIGFLAAACIAVLLSGCAAGSPQKTAPKPTAASHAPTPSATPSPAPPADLLFTISAKVRSSGGSTIGIRLDAHAPVAASDQTKAGALVDEFLEQCGDGVGGTPITHDTMVANGSTLLRLDLTSTTQGQMFVSPLDLYLGSNFSAKAASGAGIVDPPSADGCIGTYSWSKSGTAHGIAEFDSDDGTPDLSKWRYGLYGFAVQPDSNATIEGCTITMTDLATKADLKDVPGWLPSDTSGTTCATGYVGE
ncbi:hypothetical protein [Parafrigoribacterium soli]|uniref:hypothetical protein n=1 Tax=Parafrigoribacterium soli TaxID=3144663 RepID=UPI0032EEA814